MRPMETGVWGERRAAGSFPLGGDRGYDVMPVFAIVYVQPSNHVAL